MEYGVPMSERRNWLVGVGLSILVGGLVSLQSIANGTLRVAVDDALLPSLSSFVVALIIIAIIVLARSSSRAHFHDFFRQLRTKELPWYVLLAGLFGAVFSIAQAASVAILGVAVFTVAVIAGQNFGGLALDRAGIGGTGVHTLNALRIIAALIATGAVVLAVSGGLKNVSLPFVLIAFVFIGGVFVAIQLALSGQVTVAVHDPFVAALNVFVVGIVGLVVALVIHGFITPTHAGELIPAIMNEPWLAIGGVCAAIMMTASALAVPKIGVLVFSMGAVIGQLLVALVIDLIMGVVGNPTTLLLACGLTIISVIIAGQSSRTKRKAPLDDSSARAVSKG